MSNITLGFSIRIFMPDGEPEGLRIIEKSNWTGQGIMFPRSLFAKARSRKELKRAGVYILWESVPADHLPKVYVGEGDSVLPRLDQHGAKKDFWTHAVVFISKDQNLNKAHVQYIESRLVQLANQAKRCELDNDQIPKIRPLSEADSADAEGFLQNLLLCLPTVGISVFEKTEIPVSNNTDLYLKAKGINASGADTPGGFVVRAGSTAIKTEASGLQEYLKQIRQTLFDKKILVEEGNFFLFTQDYIFNSPSTAAGVLLGRSANGRTEWKDSKGISLKQIQELQLLNHE